MYQVIVFQVSYALAKNMKKSLIGGLTMTGGEGGGFRRKNTNVSNGSPKLIYTANFIKI